MKVKCAFEPVNSPLQTQIVTGRHVALDWKLNVEQRGEGPFILILDAPVRDFDVT
jgi:hypothetical protein